MSEAIERWVYVTEEMLLEAGCSFWPCLPEHYKEIEDGADRLAKHVEDLVWRQLISRGS